MPTSTTIKSELATKTYAASLLYLEKIVHLFEAGQVSSQDVRSALRGAYERLFIWGRLRGDGTVFMHNIMDRLPNILLDQVASLLLDIGQVILSFGFGQCT